MPFRITIPDDRGTPIELFRWGSKGVTAEDIYNTPELKDIVGRAKMASSPMTARKRASMGILTGLFCSFGVVIQAFLKTWIPGIPTWVTWLVTLVILILLGWVVTFWARRKYRENAARTILADGRCAGCLYPLVDVPPDHEEIVQCPECSAAWKSTRIGSPHPGIDPRSLPASRRGWRSMLPSAPCIEDDRQRVVRLADVRLASMRWAIPAEHADQIYARVRSSYFLRGLVNGIFIVGLAVPAVIIGAIWLPTYALPSSLRSAGSMHWWQLVTLLAGILYCALIILHGWRAMTGRGQDTALQVAHALKKEGLCPSCLTSLQGAKIEDQQDVICPSCAAVWRYARRADGNPQQSPSRRNDPSGDSAAQMHAE